MFQDDQANHSKLLKQLKIFTLIMLRKIIYPQNANLEVNMFFKSIYLSLGKVDFGFNCE